MIEICGKPFFYWATKSLSKLPNIIDIIFVVLQEHIDQFKIDEAILQYFPGAKIIKLPKVLNGAVLTAMEGIKLINDDNPIIFNDCDHAFQTKEFEQFLNSEIEVDGGLLTLSPTKIYLVILNMMIIKKLSAQRKKL